MYAILLASVRLDEVQPETKPFLQPPKQNKTSAQTTPLLISDLADLRLDPNQKTSADLRTVS